MKKITSFFFGIFCMLSVANAQDITVFDFDGENPSTTGWGDSFASVPNPVSDGINSSANVGLYTHTSQWASRSIEGLSIDCRYYTSYTFNVYSPVAGSLNISLSNAAGGQIFGKSYNLAVTSGWTTITESVVAGQTIAKIDISFNSSSAALPVDNVYLDDLKFIKTTSTTDLVLYSENFSAPGEWNTWTGAPSAKAGKYNGGIDFVTAGDAPITLEQWWNEHGYVLKMAPDAAAVTISNISVAGFESLVFSADATSDLTVTPSIEVRIDGGAWTALATTANTGDWVTETITLPAATSTVSLKLNPDAAKTMVFDNVKILGNVHEVLTSIEAEKSNTLSIYPNPAQDYILTPKAQKVTIADLNGSVVSEVYSTEKVDVSSLAKGVYIVKAQIDNVTKVGKLIKE